MALVFGFAGCETDGGDDDGGSFDTALVGKWVKDGNTSVSIEIESATSFKFAGNAMTGYTLSTSGGVLTVTEDASGTVFGTGNYSISGSTLTWSSPSNNLASYLPAGTYTKQSGSAGTGGGTDTANHGFTNIENVYASWSSGSYNGAFELDGTNFKKWTVTEHYDETPNTEGTYAINTGTGKITLTYTKYRGSPTSYLSPDTLSYSASGDTVTIGISSSGTSTYTYTKVSAATGSGFDVKAVESSTETTATLTILTEKAATGLTAADISLSNNFTNAYSAKALSVPTKGGLTEVSGSGGHAWRLGVTPADMGYIMVGITNSNVDTGTELAAIYKPGATIPYAVYPDTYSNSSTTTKLTIDLFKGMEGLTASDITITNGTGSATKGSTLTDKYPSLGHEDWELPITTTAAGTITVKVTKSGIDSAEHTVTIHKK
jgi:hypothetical protein